MGRSTGVCRRSNRVVAPAKPVNLCHSDPPDYDKYRAKYSIASTRSYQQGIIANMISIDFLTSQPTLKNVEYWFDNICPRGTLALIGRLALFRS